MNQMHFVGVTPEENNAQILEGVKRIIEDFKKEYNPQQQNDYLTRKQASELLSVNLSTLHTWCKEKKIVSYSVGSRVYFKRHEIENSLVKMNH